MLCPPCSLGDPQYTLGVALVVDFPNAHFLMPRVRSAVRHTPYIVGANTEELAIVNLIAEHEGIEPRP